MRAVLTTIGLLLGLTLLGAPPAAAGGYAGNNPDGAVLDSTLVAGEDAIFVADCFRPGTTVTVTVDGPGDADITVNGGTEGTNTATGVADANGAIRAVIEVDDTGTYTVAATGTRTCATGAADATFTVVSASQGSGGGAALPTTGADGTTTLLLAGGALVALGAAGVYLAARRRSGGATTA